MSEPLNTETFGIECGNGCTRRKGHAPPHGEAVAAFDCWTGDDVDSLCVGARALEADCDFAIGRAEKAEAESERLRDIYESDQQDLSDAGDTIALMSERNLKNRHLITLVERMHAAEAECERLRAVVAAANELIERHGQFHPDFWARNRNCPECTFCYVARNALSDPKETP
jgi:hypothetical protein